MKADFTFGVIKLLCSAREADLQPPPHTQGGDVVCVFGHLFFLRFLFHKKILPEVFNFCKYINIKLAN